MGTVVGRLVSRSLLAAPVFAGGLRLRRRGRRRTGTGWLAVGVLAAMLVAACGSSHSATGTKTGGSITYALDEDVAGFNILNAVEDSGFTPGIMEVVWPSAFIYYPDLKPHLNTEVVTSAKITRTNPQTVVYQINPKATWSDGTPINADDFIYNWQAQSGDPQYTDVGGQPFQPAATGGYSSIKSVTGSDNGKTATVVFAQSFGNWQSLFSEMIPAHIAKRVGFNDGFANFGPSVQVSGGPYMLQSYTQGQDVVEVPNPHYWGPPPKLSKIVYRVITDDAQQPTAAQSGEVNIVTPVLPTVEFVDQLKSVPSFTYRTLPALGFQHIDFNLANYYLANANVRHAIAYGTDRSTIVKRTADLIDPHITPLQNRLEMPTEQYYKNTSAGYGEFDTSKAKQLLQQSGMTMGSDGYFQPGAGPEKGQDLTFSISTTSGQPLRSQIEQLFQSQMKDIGVKINIQNYPAKTLFGTVIPKGEFDLAEFEWGSLAVTPSFFPSIYCSYTNADLCGSNYDRYANPQVDQLLQSGVAALNPAQAANDFNQVDALLWKDMVTLPLFQNPDLTGWSTKYANIEPNEYTGVTWNAQDWALKAST